jgi:hypothetical protein
MRLLRIQVMSWDACGRKQFQFVSKCDPQSFRQERCDHLNSRADSVSKCEPRTFWIRRKSVYYIGAVSLVYMFTFHYTSYKFVAFHEWGISLSQGITNKMTTQTYTWQIWGCYSGDCAACYPRSMVEFRCFGETCCLHLQVRRKHSKQRGKPLHCVGCL